MCPKDNSNAGIDLAYLFCHDTERNIITKTSTVFRADTHADKSQFLAFLPKDLIKGFIPVHGSNLRPNLLDGKTPHRIPEDLVVLGKIEIH